jgi:hypothetical protein
MGIVNTTYGARVQTTDSGYRIAVGDDVSAEFDFGEGAEWEAPNGKRYIAFVDLPDGAEEGDAVESEFEYWLYECMPVAGEVEEMESFGEDGEDDDGDEEDEEEEDEEDEKENQ